MARGHGKDIKLVFFRSLIHIPARIIVTYSHYQLTVCLKLHTLGKLPGITDSCNLIAGHWRAKVTSAGQRANLQIQLHSQAWKKNE